MTPSKPSPYCTRHFRFRGGVVKPLKVHRASGQVWLHEKWWEARVLKQAFAIHEVVEVQRLGPQETLRWGKEPKTGVKFKTTKYSSKRK